MDYDPLNEQDDRTVGQRILFGMWAVPVVFLCIAALLVLWARW